MKVASGKNTKRAGEAALFLGLLILTSISLLDQTPAFWSGIWDNEKLLAFDHIRLIEQGAGITNINLARIPSLFPDYALTWLSHLAGGDIRSQYLFYIIVQTCLQLSVSSWILRIITQASWLECLVVIGALTYCLGLASHAWAANHSLAALPLNHGGNLVLVLAALAFCLKLIKSQRAQPYDSLLGITLLLGSLSNRISILQIAIPTVILFTRLQGVHGNQFAYKSLARVAAFSTTSGLALSKIAIKTGCVPPLTWHWPDLARHLSSLLTFSPKEIGIGVLILTNLIICTYFWLRSRDESMKAYGLLTATGGLLVLCAYPFIFANQGLGDSGLRYLFGVIFTLPITAGTIVVTTLKKSSAVSRLIVWASAGALAATILSHPETFEFANRFTKSILEWENPYSKFIEDNLSPNDAVLTNYESGDNQQLSARSLKAGSNWKIHISQIANGDANPWDQGKSEFYKNQLTKELRNYNSLIIRPQDQESAETWYGSPEKKIINKRLNVELWIYSRAGRQKIADRIKAGLSGPFRIECL